MNNNLSRKNTPLANAKRSFLKRLLVASQIAIICSGAQAAGFSQLTVPDPGHKDLQIGVWYPTAKHAPSEPNTPFNQALALDADIEGEHLPLVMLSHGFGGWQGGHADTAKALAEAGFVVAAPSHTGNTFRDMSSTIDQWMLDRPRHISISIDFLRKQWRQAPALNQGQVGLFGFSAGGHTALSLIGAVPNMSKAIAHCESDPSEFICSEGFVAGMVTADMGSLPAEAWGKDPRIGAAAIAAPGLGIAYDKKALSDVSVPVQLWSTLQDKRVPHATNSLPIAEALQERVETHWIDNAGHFAFMVQQCTEKLKKFEPDTWDFICKDNEGFDRRAFHQSMNAEMVRFFKASLASQ